MQLAGLRWAVAALILAAAGAANAVSVTVSCPGTLATTDREFSLTTDPGTVACLATGAGNINGNNDAINQLGYVTLDKTDDSTTGLAPQSLTFTPPTSGLGGTFSINAPAGYTNFVVAFKSGQGQLSPDWAAFTLPNGVTSGSWAISGSQALSHANLYGQVVPAPATVWLLATGCAGLLFRLRRKSTTA